MERGSLSLDTEQDGADLDRVYYSASVATTGPTIVHPTTSWEDFFTANRDALDDELRHLVAELTRRLAIALDGGDFSAARSLWADGQRARQISIVLRRISAGLARCHCERALAARI